MRESLENFLSCKGSRSQNIWQPLYYLTLINKWIPAYSCSLLETFSLSVWFEDQTQIPPQPYQLCQSFSDTSGDKSFLTSSVTCMLFPP